MKSWSPLRFAIFVFIAVVVLGLIVITVIAAATGAMHDNGYARGERAGQGLGMLAAFSAAVAYLVRSRRK